MRGTTNGVNDMITVNCRLGTTVASISLFKLSGTICCTSNITQKATFAMKRKANERAAPEPKRPKNTEAAYCDAEPQRDGDGKPVWPASVAAIAAAQAFLRDWYGISNDCLWSTDCTASAKSGERTLIVPDKDADGLDAGVLLHRTLLMLGHKREAIEVHLPAKHATVHDESERKAMQAKDPKYIIVVDQGSREAPPVVDSTETRSLIIDHHLSDQFPKNATVSPFRDA